MLWQSMLQHLGNVLFESSQTSANGKSSYSGNDTGDTDNALPIILFSATDGRNISF